MKLILDASGPVKTVFHSNGDGTVTIDHIQDAEPVLELNKALATSGDGYSQSRELRRIASLDMVSVMKLQKAGIMDSSMRIVDRVRFRRWLNDPDNRFYRSTPGKA